ncbi:MAG: hypothetical protein K2Q22_13570 [Cytophagales bacterium]|nr:hypothetical protein [Cytophagales bacterium]
MSKFIFMQRIIVFTIVLSLFQLATHAQELTLTKSDSIAKDTNLLKLSEYYDAIETPEGPRHKVYMLKSIADRASIDSIMNKKGKGEAAELFRLGTRQYKPVINKVVGVAIGLSLLEFAVGVFSYSANNSLGEVFLVTGLVTASAAVPVGIVFGLRSRSGHKKIVRSLALYNEPVK